MRRMHEELNRVFSATGTGSSSGSAVSTPWIPPVEVAYKDGNYVAAAELPGLTDEDVTVEIDDDAIVIHGERQIEHKEALIVRAPAVTRVCSRWWVIGDQPSLGRQGQVTTNEDRAREEWPRHPGRRRRQ